MGSFAEPAEVRGLTTIKALLNLTDYQLDELYIIPAERVIEERFNLDLNTADEPRAWAGTFDSYPAEKTKYLDDYRRSVVLLVNHYGATPYGERSQNIGGASMSFSRNFPAQIDALMINWGRPSNIVRR